MILGYWFELCRSLSTQAVLVKAKWVLTLVLLVFMLHISAIPTCMLGSKHLTFWYSFWQQLRQGWHRGGIPPQFLQIFSGQITAFPNQCFLVHSIAGNVAVVSIRFHSLAGNVAVVSVRVT